MSIRSSIALLLLLVLIGGLIFFLITNLTSPEDMPVVTWSITLGSVFLMLSGFLSIVLFLFNKYILQERKHFYNLEKSIKHSMVLSAATIVVMIINIMDLMGILQLILIYGIAILFNSYLSFKEESRI